LLAGVIGSRLTLNQRVQGSNPCAPTIDLKGFIVRSHFSPRGRFLLCNQSAEK
jgi:hypothetical protein